MSEYKYMWVDKLFGNHHGHHIIYEECNIQCTDTTSSEYMHLVYITWKASYRCLETDIDETHSSVFAIVSLLTNYILKIGYGPFREWSNKMKSSAYYFRRYNYNVMYVKSKLFFNKIAKPQLVKY